eukprot:CAMPEP_0168327826 /NCGR_PEP_ID=MMETSP0213-20121227/6112_1 /TAXON_ID=151035 /ORGANISM="Euplotes harpa, Strain FSP1.4" /LENGTH=229 /DNA_ID=CAMNT_0008330771 /DNA_START=66 /DNA_END=755 /DNA_ORIENTATION=+
MCTGFRIPHKKTRIFDKYQYNPTHIPYEAVYNIKRKPRQAIWDEENPKYEFSIQPPTKSIGKTLIGELEKEEKEKLIEAKDFKIPDFRPGDLLEVSEYLSLSEKKINTYKGIVISIKNKNSLMHFINIVCYHGGYIANIGLRVNNPLIAKISVLKYGSNKNKNKLNHVWKEEWSKAKVEQPLIKGKGYVPRGKKMKEKRRNILGNIEDPLNLKSSSKNPVKAQSMVIEE